MEALAGDESAEPRWVRVVGSELVENYTVYVIEVYVGIYNWKVKHRYSDFYELHEKLTLENNIDKNLLPPKKIIGKNSKSLVEKRQKDLEVYLQTLLTQFPVVVPRSLSHFLHFHLYEINGIAAVLAEELFNKGEQLLSAGEVFVIKPLQLYAVTQLLRHAKPTCVNGDAKTDLGHILDFTCRLKYLKITGTRGPVGTSNIQEHVLAFDLSIFKSLCQIEISHCDAKNITGLNSCKNTLATLNIQFSTTSMKDILAPEASEFDQWEAEGTSSDCPITAVIPKWRTLTTLDMSHNLLSCIDDSVKLIPEIEYLALSHNTISSVENLQHLYNLIHLDLSYNKLSVLDGIHTKLGNVKTLNLAGNLFESLSGLNKLYSLVNLDLSNNKIKQFEEIKYIGHLPCLENITMTHNPLAIIPDYRTKVLAQFGERASEVCLDSTSTTEKELDTVEVLKAIQKAKETKNKLNPSDKKMGEESGLTAARSKANSPSSFISNASCPPLSGPVYCIQEQDEVDSSGKHRFLTLSLWDIFAMNWTISCELGLIAQHQCPTLLMRLWLNRNYFVTFAFLLLTYSMGEEQEKSTSPERHPPEIPCSPYCDKDEDLIPYFTATLAHAFKQTTPVAEEDGSQMNTGIDTRTSEPEDGYFEMGLHEGARTLNHSDSPLTNPEDTSVRVLHLLWTFSIQLQTDLPFKQFVSCLVLTDTVMAFFKVIGEGSGFDHLASPSLLKLAFYCSYADVLEFGFIIPEICLTLKVRNGKDYMFILANPESLRQLYRHLCVHKPESCMSLQYGSSIPSDNMTLQDFMQHLAAEHHMNAENGSVEGYFPVCLFHGDLQERMLAEKPTCAKLYSTIYRTSDQNNTELLPSWIFLTQQNLVIMKTDFTLIPGKWDIHNFVKNVFSLKEIPLSRVVLDPGYKSLQERDGHVLQFIMENKFLTAFFVLPRDKLHFITMYNMLRTSLQCVKEVAVFKFSESLHHPDKSKPRFRGGTEQQGLSLYSNNNPQFNSPALYPPQSLFQKLSEENQVPFYLTSSSSFSLISEMNGRQILEFFHTSISEVTGEELRHLMWSSVIFYKQPDLEVTSCVLLSTKAIYFLLDASLQQLHLTQLDSRNQNKVNTEKESSCLISYCFVIKFSDLQSVNIGLFDQYFRITGPSPSHVVTCVTRDSYCTHGFIQHLMSALSLLARTPSPEPAEKDFYSEFGNKNTGKMENYELIHSSKVKFIYPNEEEIGDLTFIVKEKTESPVEKLQSLHILLYALAFQVNSTNGNALETILVPKTLILTNSDLFLFNEDYISYPLPDFAKEPPKTDKYQLMDARRIRDLDRVLLGYQTYPQTLTFVFDDIPSQDLTYTLSMDHFGDASSSPTFQKPCVGNREVQWYIFIPSADCREKLISLLARQWELLCGRELPLELTG
ncbi:nischarin [Pelodytes ibericus]